MTGHDGWVSADETWAAIHWVNGKYISIHNGRQVSSHNSLETAKKFIQKQSKKTK